MLSIIDLVRGLQKLGWTKVLRLFGIVAAIDAGKTLYLRWEGCGPPDYEGEWIGQLLAYALVLTTQAMFDFGDQKMVKSLGNMRGRRQAKQQQEAVHNHSIIDMTALVAVKVLLALATFFSVRNMIGFEIVFGVLLLVDAVWLFGRAAHFKAYGPGVIGQELRYSIKVMGEAACRWAWINFLVLVAGLWVVAVCSLGHLSQVHFHSALLGLGFVRNVADLWLCHSHYLEMRRMK